jgi:ATP-binding cassette subfamily B protein
LEEEKMEVFKWLWSNLKGYRLRMLLGLVMVVAVSSFHLVNPYISGRIVDDVIYGGKTDILLNLVLLMIGATLVRSMLKYCYQLNFESVSQKVVHNIRMNIFRKLQELDFGFFDKNRTGDLMARMTGDTDMMRHFIAWVIYATFENGAIFIYALISMSMISLRLTLMLLVLTPLTAFFANKMSRTIRPAFFAVREQFSRLNTVVQENISGNRVVKAFTKEDYEIEKFDRENNEYRNRNLDIAKVHEKYLPILELIAGSLTVLVILVGGILVISDVISIGELVTFNGCIWMMNGPMRMLGTIVNDYQRFSTSGEKILAVLKTEPKIKNSEHVVKKDRIDGAVEFRNVSFSYGDEEVLKDISFKAYPGQTVAIVGPTGSGKSTLISLIGRYYDCTDGAVLVDGINVKDIDLKLLRKNISVAMQDIFLFSDTIEGNIAYGIPDADMEQVIAAAEAADAHNFITKLPEGYDTIIGERGVGLSGGQRQRLALARAILKDPSILILDDTTSSVDMETEHKIQKTLKSISQNRTTFIIAHRISSVKNADLILVLEKGRIIERGKHDELIKQKGYYYKVYMNQYGDFDEAISREVV